MAHLCRIITAAVQIKLRRLYSNNSAFLQQHFRKLVLLTDPYPHQRFSKAVHLFHPNLVSTFVVQFLLNFLSSTLIAWSCPFSAMVPIQLLSHHDSWFCGVHQGIKHDPTWHDLNLNVKRHIHWPQLIFRDWAALLCDCLFSVCIHIDGFIICICIFLFFVTFILCPYYVETVIMLGPPLENKMAHLMGTQGAKLWLLALLVLL